jgi:hypothetical protein
MSSTNSNTYYGTVTHSYAVNEEKNPKKKYTKTELGFLVTMGIFLFLLVAGVIAVIVVTTTHTTPCGGSITNVSPAPQPERPRFI